ncbi:integrase [Paucibacter sp. DJ1R-11]|uniref:integrase n=1 Tax=Paucibacter sp. DJ1R-11 TaxID=2893556 RepID=UPI0021E36FA5|nr:integrase [Paucibacter sp. DJ1R-11]MCV2363134.1 integrase [Paucibacter sp. DJ1R-11]
MNPFLKDKTVWLSGVEMRVVRQLGDEEVQLENVNSGELVNHKTFNLLEQYTSGELLTEGQRRHLLRTSQKVSRPPARMDHMSAAAKCETRRRMDYLIRLERMGAFQKSRLDLVQDIKIVAATKGEGRPPHVTTIYRWKEKYQKAQNDVRALFCRFDEQGGKGRSRLDPEVEAIIHDKIETVFLSKKKSSGEEVHNAVFLEIQRRNTQRVESEWLEVPGLRTIQRRLTEIFAFELAVARFGQKEAERRFAHHLGARAVARILELVEIDHSPVDILVTDEDGLVIGRPNITVVIDRYSRCVLGFHLSLVGHGTPEVFAALRHALLPKTYLKDRYADLLLEWECFGWFEVLLMDNGREFHAESVTDALLNLSIATEYAKSKTPNDKPHVERFLKTFNYSFIHRLPGTTLDKVHKRIGFKAEDSACMTLTELDRAIHVWICQVYHLRPNAGLNGRAPMTVWREGAKAFPPQLKANAEDLDIEFSQVCTSALQHYGIDLNTFVYVSPRLLTLRRMLPEGTRVDVKWPAQDAGHIFVWDRLNEEYFKVGNKDKEYVGLTVEQAQVAKKAKAKADPNSQLAQASAEAVIREMADSALKDKKLKNRRKGTRLANDTTEVSRRPAAAAERSDETSIEAPLQPNQENVTTTTPEIEMEWSEALP